MGLFRPTVTRTQKDGTKLKKKSRTWWGSFRHPQTGKRVRISLKTQDRKAAELALSSVVQRAYQEKAGLTDPYENHLKRPLAEHVDDWQQSLVDRNLTLNYVRLSVKRVQTILAQTDTASWAEINPEKVTAYLARRRRGGLSIESSNHYLRRIKQFCGWMMKTGRAPRNPLRSLSLLNANTDRRRERRALLHGELKMLISTTSGQPPRYGLTGPARALLYRMVCETGLRAAEVRQLTDQSFDLEGKPPVLVLPGRHTKNRRDVAIPLLRTTTEKLRELLAQVNTGHPVFPYWCQKSADMLQEDLKAAGIPYVDDQGRYVDFHALRHTYCSNLGAAGIPIADMMQLTRHSSPSVLKRYLHGKVLEGQAELMGEALPDLSNIEEDQDGRDSREKCWTYVGQTSPDGPCRSESLPVAHDEDAQEDSQIRKRRKKKEPKDLHVVKRRPESPSDAREWMGIEPTWRRANRRHNGFEGREKSASPPEIAGCWTNVVPLRLRAMYEVFEAGLPVEIKAYLLRLIETASDVERP